MSTRKPLPDEETRYWRTDLEVRSESQRRIGGVAVPYNRRSQLLPGGFYEIVENRSAVAKTLGDKLNVTLLLEHRPDWLLASTDSDTMRLVNDEAGLGFDADLPNTSAGNDAWELIRTKRIKGTSIGFIAMDSEFRREGATVVRYLSAMRLLHISPTAQPAYPSTITAVRSLAAQIGEDPADVELLAAQGELRSLFGPRSDLAVVAPPTVLPVPTPLEARHETAGDRGDAPNELQRKIREHARRRNNWSAPTFEGGEGMLDLYNRRVKMNESGELRSVADLVTVESRTARGHLIDLPVGPDVHDYGRW
jgi:HK97 family phage prohead protease